MNACIRESFQAAQARNAVVMGLHPPIPSLTDECDSWYSIRGGDNGVAFVHIGDEIGVNQPTESLIEALTDATEIRLDINSRGGDSAGALEIHRAIKGRCSVATIVRAHSAAVEIALAAERVEIWDSGDMMLHSPRLWRFGNAVELRQSSYFLERLTAKIINELPPRIDRALYLGWLAGGEHTFSPPEAVKVGLAHTVVATPRAATGEQPVPPFIPASPEQEFLNRLHAVKNLTVADRERFVESLLRWQAFAVREQG